MEQTFIIPESDRRSRLVAAFKFAMACRTGTKLKLTIKPFRRDRSQDQNAALFGVAYPPLMAYMGLRGDREKQELHNVICGLYFGKVEVEVLGERVTRPKRTTTTNEAGERDLVDTAVMADLYAFVQKLGADNGVYIHDPESGVRGVRR